MLKIPKLLVGLLLASGILFATHNNAIAGDDPVHLSVPYTLNFVIEYQHCKATAKKQGAEIVVLTNIIANKTERASNLFRQNAMMTENYEIKKQQADEWKKEYTKTAKALVEAKKVPWYKFNLKSVLTGIVIALIPLGL